MRLASGLPEYLRLFLACFSSAFVFGRPFVLVFCIRPSRTPTMATSGMYPLKLVVSSFFVSIIPIRILLSRQLNNPGSSVYQPGSQEHGFRRQEIGREHICRNPRACITIGCLERHGETAIPSKTTISGETAVSTRRPADTAAQVWCVP